MIYVELPSQIDDIELLGDAQQIQVVVGLLGIGESTTTRSILHITDVVSPSITLYTGQMKCLGLKTNLIGFGGRGANPTRVTRKSMPGKVCEDNCQRASSCLLREIYNSDTNIILLPESVRDKVKVK